MPTPRVYYQSDIYTVSFSVPDIVLTEAEVWILVNGEVYARYNAPAPLKADYTALATLQTGQTFTYEGDGGEILTTTNGSVVTVDVTAVVSSAFCVGRGSYVFRYSTGGDLITVSQTEIGYIFEVKALPVVN